MNFSNEKLKNYLYDSHDLVIRLVNSISNIAAMVSFALMIYRYGFYLTDEETFQVFFYVDIIFGVYLVTYLIRLIYNLSSVRHFLRLNWLESFFMVFVLLSGSINLVFGVKIVYELFELLGVKYPILSSQHFITVYLVMLIGIEIGKVSTSLPNVDMKPTTMFLLSFVILIFGGALMLMLPTMTPGKGSLPFIDALFTSTSASCVTGLIVVDTRTAFTSKGHVIILLLIQLGGIGIISFATFIATFLSKGVGIKHQAMIQDYLGSESLVSATILLRKVIFLTIGIELAGAVAIYFSWEEEYWDNAHQFASIGDKIFYSIFHSISAFCNAGFSLYTGGMYDKDFDTHRMFGLHFVIALIIIFGGLGFTTIDDIFSPKNIVERLRKPWKKVEINTLLNFKVSVVLILVGLVAFMIFEFDKLTDRTILEAMITAFFQSVVTRTAGFNSMSFAELTDATIMICIILMFIGAASGSTAGGIKITTFVLIFLGAAANIRRQERIIIRGRTISDDDVRKSFAIFIFAVSYCVIAVFLLTITETPAENEKRFILKIIFEQVSAFATVGLSMDFTATLSYWGKWIIITSMYLGRVGTITLAFALSDSVISNSYRYPKAHIMVG